MKLKKEEEIDFSIPVEDVLSSLDKVKKSGTRQWVALCPSHDDQRQSLSVGSTPDGKALLHCHAGCEYIDIITVLGLYKEAPTSTKREIVETYDYCDEVGELLYQVVRFNPKGFSQRRPVGNDWVYNLKGVQRVLYRLPEVINASGTVIVVEGEKDVDNLRALGLIATTNSGGAGKWIKDYNKYFRAKDVVIIPDNDKSGLEHADVVSKNVYPTANSVKILHLDFANAKEDVTDWLKTHDAKELEALITAEPKLELSEDELETDTSLPHYSEGETAILGAVLRQGKLIHKVIKSEVDKDFYINKNKIILKAMLECFEEKQGIDYIVVAEKLKQYNRLEYIGGLEYLKTLRDEAPDANNIESWISIVQGKANLRKFLEIGNRAVKMSQGELDTPENIGDEIVQNVFKMNRKNKKGTFTHLTENVNQIISRTRELAEGEVVGLSTGFPKIDDITSGLQKTDFIVIAGRPSMGKTAFALNIAYNASKKHTVAFFSLEMSKDQLISRILCSEARVNQTDFKTNNLNEHDWARIANVVPEMEGTRLFIDDTPSISVLELRSKLYGFEQEYEKPELIVIDYMQLMSGTSDRENRQQQVSQISRELKGLAKEMDVPVVALSQLSRAPEARNPPKPLMSDLRESGSIEQDADVVAFLYREDYYNETEDNKGIAQVIFAKQRNGGTGPVELAFLREFSRFENLHLFEPRIKLS